MIDWNETALLFGHRSAADLTGKKRPKVVCVCDHCDKRRTIAIRVKFKIVDNQMKWRCPSCVCLGRSENISIKMKACWESDDYRTNQLQHKEDVDYKEMQAQKSRDRWADEEYRNKLETGIDAATYIEKCTNRFNGQFVYRRSSFINWKHKISITCTVCGIAFDKMPLVHLQVGACPVCKLPGKLRATLPAPYTLNDRTAIAPLELDVYWPDKKIALEYHGSYWHSYDAQESPAEKARHQIKALRCIDNGIRLYQFFDFEWRDQEQIVNSILRNAFGESDRIGARKLSINAINAHDSQEFFNANHLQGHRYAGTTLALCNSKDIVMAMSFSCHGDGYEIIRMATKIGYSVPGGASRLLHHFRRNVDCPIYTFADLRYSIGSVYEAIGFERIKITNPNYSYYKNNTFLSRQRCQKHRLPALLSVFDDALSEPDNMFNNGYRRIWDAGNIKLVNRNSTKI